MSDAKHISEIIDSIGEQQSELKKIFGENAPITSSKTLSQKEDAERSYLRTIRYWMDKVSEAQYHIRKNQKKIEELYE
jgi:hypothetical protein